MWTLARAARYQLGQLLGGDEGAVLVAEAEHAMKAEGVRAPARMAGFLLPGRWSAAARTAVTPRGDSAR